MGVDDCLEAGRFTAPAPKKSVSSTRKHLDFFHKHRFESGKGQSPAGKGLERAGGGDGASPKHILVSITNINIRAETGVEKMIERASGWDGASSVVHRVCSRIT